MNKDFKTYNLAVAFYKDSLTLKLKAHLKDQLERAAASVALNLAEGAGRFSPADQRRFFSIAYGSLKECQAILDLSLPKDHSLWILSDLLGAHLYRLIKSFN